jgi:hypothetical protein
MAQVIEAPARLIFAWVEYALHPIDSTEALLRQRSDTVFSQPVVEIWATSAVIFMLITMPVAYLFGISLKDADFFAVWQALILIFHALVALIVHAMLLAFRQRSDLTEIVKMYTITIVYIPLYGVLNLPRTFQLYNKIRAAKHDSDHMDVLTLAANLLTPVDDQLSGLNEIATVLGYAILFTAAATFTEAIIAWYGNRRFLSYLSVGAAGVLAFIPVAGIGMPLYILNVYAHVQ